MTLFEISDEFLQEELATTGQNSKKGGPYSKHNRKNRREEVFKLYFDYGFSISKISEMMRVNRKTISKDIEFWQDRLEDEWGKQNIVSGMMKIIHRQDLQRTRLRQELDNQTDSEEKRAWEKLIMQVQSNMANNHLRLATTEKLFLEFGQGMTNKFLKENNSSMRAVGMFELRGISKEAREKIDEILKDSEDSNHWRFDDIEEEDEM